MNVLVTYFSQSGNTEKIARAIYEEAILANQAALKILDEITPDEVTRYDVIFLGSPLHSGSLAKPVEECLCVLKPCSGQKMAGFITHFAPAYPEQDMDGFTEPIKNACRKNSITYKGCFDCQGYLADSMHEAVQKKISASDEQWATMVEEMSGRPNDEDVVNAKAFAREVLNS